MAEEDLRFFNLNTGARMPSLAFSTCRIRFRRVTNGVIQAVKAGYRHIDCSTIDWNQKEIGSALEQLFDEGVVRREEIWITAKVWVTDLEPNSLESTLADLKLDYVDLYLLQWPKPLKTVAGIQLERPLWAILEGVWEALETVYYSGKAKAIGVSNFSYFAMLELFRTARVIPAVLQVECFPSWRRDTLHELCKSRGIHLSGHSPLGFPSPDFPNKKSEDLKSTIIITIAERLGKTPAQVALRWGLQMGHSIVLKSEKEERVKENLDVLDWSIPKELFSQLHDIPQVQLIIPGIGAQISDCPQGSFLCLD